ncbi:MAG: leucyl aminopeptidase, partial [Woeseiaceae bacterium]|nr:leucyl aminopeptidase [Woeseiaceae bacterium]
MKYFTTSSNVSRRTADCVIVGVYDGGKLGAGAADIDTASEGYLRSLIKSGDISGESGRVTVLAAVPGVKATRVVVVSLGKRGEMNAAGFRKAVATATRAIAHTKTKQLLNALTLEPVAKCDAYYLARHTVETISESLYRFDQMKSGRKRPAMPLQAIGLAILSRGDAKKATLGAEHGDGIAAGVSLAKDLGNLPANVCTPSYLARVAKSLATGNGKLTTRVLSEAEMKKLGMGSLLSVTAGAIEPAKLIIMRYKGAGSERPVVLVGKGVTFDTGGISLKPGAGMDEMKFDMCGAA